MCRGYGHKIKRQEQKQKCLFSQFWRLESKMEVMAEPSPVESPGGGPVLGSKSFLLFCQDALATLAS